MPEFAQAATRDRVRAASAAAQAAAATTAMPGDLEDLGGAPAADIPLPDAAEIARLRAEVEQRKAEMTRSMMAARDSATALGKQATEARAAGRADEATQLDRRADAERARMHALLGELATLETELAELERVRKTIQDAPRGNPHAPAAESYQPPPRARPTVSVDDALHELKKRAGTSGAAGSTGPARPPPASSASSRTTKGSNVDDELAALKRKMASAPPKKK